MDTNIFKKAYDTLLDYINDDVSLGDLVMTMSKAIHVGQELMDKYVKNQPTNTSTSFTIPATDEHMMLFNDDSHTNSSFSYTTAPQEDPQIEYITHVTNNGEQSYDILKNNMGLLKEIFYILCVILMVIGALGFLIGGAVLISPFIVIYSLYVMIRDYKVDRKHKKRKK